MEGKSTLRIKLKAANQEKYFTSGKNISRICLETLLKSLTNQQKKIMNSQLDIKLRQSIEEDVALKRIKSRKAIGLDKISLEVWKSRKFDYILI